MSLLRSEATGLTAVLVELLGRYGLRPAEARAVLWSAIDWDGALLAVGPRLNRSNERIDPKTRTAERSLRLTDETLGLLRRWRAEQAELEKTAASLWLDCDLIVTNEIGEPVNYWFVPQALAALCNRIGITPSVSPYELRHTAISFQADAGHSAWAIADWAGTSERMIADVYRHKLVGTSLLSPPKVGSVS
ncbi:MAG: tyrosine-type recombinase/integrase [Actinomycetota bacterium]